MRFLIYALLTFTSLFYSVPAALSLDNEAGDFKREVIKVNTVDRVFFYHIPKHYTGAATPIVFLFHGGGGTALPFASDIRFSVRADQNDFIAVAPQGYDNKWNYGIVDRISSKQKDIEFSRQMIAYMQAHYNVDASRIYFGGFSEGAWFTQWATYSMPNIIAAAAPVCAIEPTQWEAIYGKAHAHLPIVFFLGTADPRMHWNGGITPNGTSVISANGTVWSWIRSNRCDEHACTELLPNISDTDRSRVELTYYRGPQKDDVAYYKVIGGGHAWPGAVKTVSQNGNVNEDIDATQTIWDFFKAHPKTVINSPSPVAPI